MVVDDDEKGENLHSKSGLTNRYSYVDLSNQISINNSVSVAISMAISLGTYRWSTCGTGTGIGIR